MHTKTFRCSMILLLAVILAAPGCETMAGSAGTGAGIGALAGGIIGHQSGRGWEGALIGAAVGSIAGLVVHDVRQRQLATRAEVEEQLRSEGRPVPTEPSVSVQQLAPTPESVQRGDEVWINGEYLAIGSDNPPVGKYRLYKDGELAREDEINMDLRYAGQSEFGIPIEVPQDAASGLYDVEVELANGDSRDVRRTQFTVA